MSYFIQQFGVGAKRLYYVKWRYSLVEYINKYFHISFVYYHISFLQTSFCGFHIIQYAINTGIISYNAGAENALETNVELEVHGKAAIGEE